MPRSRTSRVLVTGIAILGIAFAPITSHASVTTAPDSEPAAASPLTAESTVTLLTGDKVTLGAPDPKGEPSVRIEPRTPGSGAFSIHRDHGRVTVIPKDVEPLVPNVLDPALFDVTGLVEMGYDDAHRADLPVIVRQNARSLAAADVRFERELPSIGASAGVLPKQRAAALGEQLTANRAVIGKFWLDRRMSASRLPDAATAQLAAPAFTAAGSVAARDGYLDQVKAPAAWARGLDGHGVKVAIIDTGVDSGHPALAGKVTAEADFTGSAGPADDNGHGTHVSSLIAGNGAGSDGARQGIAPAVDLISAKVLTADATGQESWVIAGMEWAAAQNADVANLSLSSPPPDGDDPVALALDALTAQSGTLFVAAAGNRGGTGSNPFTIGSPGIADSALTVGAADPAGKEALFSSEGPTRGTYRLKPDLIAPGVNILGARAGARDSDLYVQMSGTSQATPLVAGAAALMLQAHPDHTWKQLKADLTSAADATKFFSSWSDGSGVLDLQKASGSQVSTDLPSLDFGYLRYPDKAPRSRVLTLTNHGTEPLTVSVTDSEKSPANVVAPDSAVAADPAVLTIPAGGSASSKVTVDPAVLPDGMWQGGVNVLAANQPLLHLAFSAYDEPESYDLSVRVLDRTGAPYAGGVATVFNYDTGTSVNLTLDPNGEAKTRLFRGRVSVLSAVTTPAAGDRPETFSVAGTAEIPLTADTSYEVDARKAQVLRAPTIAGRPTTLQESAVSISRHSSDSRSLSDFWFFRPEQIAAGTVFVQPTAQVLPAGAFEASNRWRLEPTGKIRAGDPQVYELLLVKDRFELPLSPRLERKDLVKMARVENIFDTVSGPGTQQVERAWSTAGTGIGFVNRRPVQVPSKQVELLTASPGAEWNQCLTVTTASTTDLCDRQNLPFTPGAKVSRSFGVVVHPAVNMASHTPTYLYIDIGLADAYHAGHVPHATVKNSQLTLFRNGELVGDATNTFGYFSTPNASASFRLEHTWQLDSAVFPTSTSAKTTWNFISAPPPDPTKSTGQIPALLDLSYDAKVDGLGRAAAWRPLQINLRVDHLIRSTASRVTGAALWYSTDNGNHWTRALTVPKGSGYVSIVPPWTVLPGKTLSLRATATDAAGGSIDQTVIGAIPIH